MTEPREPGLGNLTLERPKIEIPPREPIVIEAQPYRGSDMTAANEKKRRKLWEMLRDRGIDSNRELPTKLANLSLEDLRIIHFLSIPTSIMGSNEGIGSVGFEFKKPSSKRTVTDFQDPQYSVDVTTNDDVVDLHFVPFGNYHHSEGNLTQTMFLGGIDLLSTIDWVMKNNKIPKIVKGYTNLAQAKFAIKQLGFHSTGTGGRRRFDLKTLDPFFQERLTTKEIESLLAGNIDSQDPLAKKTKRAWVSIFVSGEELFSEDMKRKIERILDLSYRRLANAGETSDALEKRLRIDAIHKSMENPNLLKLLARKLQRPGRK